MAVERKLASVQQIVSINPIANADSLERATVLGWQVVVKRGEFNSGDLCVYCEIDSQMPERPEFEFLRPLNFKIKTARLRGQVSQGICFPLAILGDKAHTVQPGEDVTELLGVKKIEYEVSPDMIGKIKGHRPAVVPSTDLFRVQAVPHLLKKYKGVEGYATEKLDGNSITCFIREGIFGVCSKDVEIIDHPGSVHWEFARKYDIENKLRSLNRDFALQGELIGEGIHKNKYKIQGKEVYFFNAFDIKHYYFYDFDPLCELLDKLQLKMVPVVSSCFEMLDNIEALVNLSVGKSVFTDGQREGIVFGPKQELTDMCERVRFKVINPEFLLKHKQ